MTTSAENLQARPRIAAPKLGEELPIFCERCGYSLHGLTQVRCEHCQLLQFHCPECGHHQPINTLRPAAHRLLGIIRAFVLVMIVVFKLNFFGWLLFGWFAMGVEWSYQYTYAGMPSWGFEMLVMFTLFAVPFAVVGRMLLLRWGRDAVVGIALAALVVGATALGWWFRIWLQGQRMAGSSVENPLFPYMLVWTGGVIAIASIFAWPVWVGLVRIFLPRKAGDALLAWQRSQSSRAAASLGRD